MVWQGGRLRAVTEFERALIPPGLSGKLSAALEDESAVTIDYAGDLVLEQHVPYRIRVQQLEPGTDFPADLLQPDVVGETTEALRLGLLLSSKREPAPVVHRTWQVYIDPLSSGVSTSWNDPRHAPAFVPAALTGEEATDWKTWTERVSALRRGGVAVAIRRTLMAATERVDPSDALVDAVIAWENLVGSRRGEPTLRISTALAWLIGDNTEQRAEVQRTVARLYDLRSDVVHGNRFLETHEAVEKRNSAVRLTVEALRRLFLNRSDLLTECRGGDERSRRLILGD